ncbi:MAG: adenylyltransferase/cytidyltransferase family protein [bacterium]|nr:adenylyltransferase/cytidyltransferase family protein [bacterium]
MKGGEKRRVVVFGIFDEVHEGHRFLFEQAKQHGDELIAIVGRDSFVREFKHKEPKHSEQERVKMVREEPLIDQVVLSDEMPSTYGVLEEIDPDVICLGYDQDALEKDVREWMRRRGVSIPLHRARKLSP